jgi:hypothetical protein
MLLTDEALESLKVRSTFGDPFHQPPSWVLTPRRRALRAQIAEPRAGGVSL